MTFLNTGLMPKRVEIVHQALPGARLFGVLVNGKSPNIDVDKRDIRQAAATSGVEIAFLEAAGRGGPDRAFAESAEKKVETTLSAIRNK